MKKTIARVILFLLVAGTGLFFNNLVSAQLTLYDAKAQGEHTGKDQDPGVKFGVSSSNDTSPLLRDMKQMLIGPQIDRHGLAFQSIVSPEAMPAQAIIFSGVSLDTKGEMGATQYVRIVNKGIEVIDKATGTSVLGPLDISTIWVGFGGVCETGGSGNPVVLYDKTADRWLISQFATATGGKRVTEECFAISTSMDATGSYNRYAFQLGANFLDSPHLSVRTDGYVMGDNVFNSAGTERNGSQSFVFDRAAMLAGTRATFTSPGIDTGVGETYSVSAHEIRFNSTPNAPTTGLTINLTYASDATFIAAGLSPADIVSMKAANTLAASQFTKNFNDPINVNIFVTAVPGTSTLGQSSSSIFSQPFTTGIRDPTRADATTPDDATMAGAGGSVPAGLADPIGGAHNWWVTRAQRKALGIAADDLTSDGTYTFGGGFSYTYDPNNRAVAGKTDYIGVSMHEFSEIMGRIPGLGDPIGGNPAYLQMDLFHYTAANTRGLTSGAGRFFSFNNGTTLLKAFNFPNGGPSDSQDWASGTNDSFNAFSSSGMRNDLTAVDLQVMDVIGYNLKLGGSRKPFDFDGDGMSDVSIYRNSEGNWYLNRSSAGFNVIHWGAPGGTDTLVPGDYDNDGKADEAIFRPDQNEANPDYFVLNSNGFTFTGVSWGVPGDKPVVGDYDGDGKTDFAVFRPSNGTWYIIYSSGVGNQVQQFGLNGDIPLANGGVSKSTLAVFRPGNNTWYIARSTGVPAQNFDSIQFGQSGDKLVPADYDGDGNTDIAVFRPSNGTWYIISSKTGLANIVKFGQAGDIPVPGDYDGDGTDDIAVYRAGTWYINRSTAGFNTVQFGVSTDTPIPSVFTRDIP